MARKKQPQTPAETPPAAAEGAVPPAGSADAASGGGETPPATKQRRKREDPPADAVPPPDPVEVLSADDLVAPPAEPAHPAGAEPALDEAAAIRTFEALLFASEVPLSAAATRKLVPGATPARVRRWAETLGREYDERGRAFQIREIAGGWQILSRPEHHDAIARMQKVRSEGKLSSAALETLAIVAYRQPINRADLESIRGVGTGPLLRALMEKGLVKVAGKEETLGRPVLYGTTEKFLELLALPSLKDLPKPEDLKG